MTGKLRWAALTATAGGLIGLSSLTAQPPDGGPKDGPFKGAKGRFGGPGKGRPDENVRVDKEVEDWINMLVNRITDRHDDIRESARAALVAVGPAALPTLRRLADNSDAAIATAARRVMNQIEHGPFAMGPGPGGPMPPFGDRPFGRPGGKADRPDGPGRPEGKGERPEGKGDRPEGKGDRPGRPDGDRRPDSPPRGGPEQLMRTIRGLGLSDEQRERVEAIIKPHQEKMQSIRERARDGELEPEQARASARREMESLHEKLKDVLTSEQFRRLQSEMRPPDGTGEKGGGRPPRPDRD